VVSANSVHKVWHSKCFLRSVRVVQDRHQFIHQMLRRMAIRRFSACHILLKRELKISNLPLISLPSSCVKTFYLLHQTNSFQVLLGEFRHTVTSNRHMSRELKYESKDEDVSRSDPFSLMHPLFTFVFIS
jgi:hypothetical protein